MQLEFNNRQWNKKRLFTNHALQVILQKVQLKSKMQEP